MFGLKFLPFKRSGKHNEQNKLIQAKTILQIVNSLGSMGLLPLISFIWAMAAWDSKSFYFFWNIVFFGNSAILCYIVQSSTLRKYIEMAKDPNLGVNKYPPISVAVQECPTRQFKVGLDIYTLSFYLCQNKRIFRNQNLLESEVPSTAQVSQIFLTMVFCSFSQILIAVTVMYTMTKEVVLLVEPIVMVVRFVTLSLIHFKLANEYNTALKCMKYLSLHEEKFKFHWRAYFACQLSILSVLAIECLSINYIMLFTTTLDVLNNFIKMYILATFDDMFIEPFRHSSMAYHIGKSVNINRFRKDKIYIKKKDI